MMRLNRAAGRLVSVRRSGTSSIATICYWWFSQHS